jgi:hypothetical protein
MQTQEPATNAVEQPMEKIDNSMIKPSIAAFPLSPIFQMNQLQQRIIAEGKTLYKFGFG